MIRACLKRARRRRELTARSQWQFAVFGRQKHRVCVIVGANTLYALWSPLADAGASVVIPRRTCSRNRASLRRRHGSAESRDLCWLTAITAGCVAVVNELRLLRRDFDGL